MVRLLIKHTGFRCDTKLKVLLSSLSIQRVDTCPSSPMKRKEVKMQLHLRLRISILWAKCSFTCKDILSFSLLFLPERIPFPELYRDEKYVILENDVSSNYLDELRNKIFPIMRCKIYNVKKRFVNVNRGMRYINEQNECKYCFLILFVWYLYNKKLVFFCWFH